MQSPFSWLHEARRSPLFIGLLFATVGMMYWLNTMDIRLNDAGSDIRKGIVELELPWTPERAEHVVSVWERNGVIDIAKTQTGYDFLLLLLYPLTLSLACTMLAGSDKLFVVHLFLVLSWLALLCIPLDALENLLIFRMLEWETQTPLPQVTSMIASLKFSVIVLTGNAVMAGFVFRVTRYLLSW